MPANMFTCGLSIYETGRGEGGRKGGGEREGREWEREKEKEREGGAG